MRTPRSNVPWLGPDDAFPPVENALPESSGLGGLLAAGGDLSPERLLAAYRAGIFPWYSDRQPILWWSPDPRMVLDLQALRISHSLVKTLRRTAGDPARAIRFDGAFDAVLAACRDSTREGQSGTWITDDIVTGYRALHRRGYAHSFESWHRGELVGGGYGVVIGRMFFGESMFARETDASKIALVGLAWFLQREGFRMIDCQQNTRHLASLGAQEIPRAAFCARVRALTRAAGPAKWVSAVPLAEIAAFAVDVRSKRRADDDASD